MTAGEAVTLIGPESRIQQPRSVGTLKERHSVQIRASLSKNRLYARLGGAVFDEQKYSFNARKMPDEFPQRTPTGSAQIFRASR